MARIVQILLPLVAVALAEAQLPNIPFFDNIPGLHHPPRPIADNPRDNRITHKNVGYNGGYDTWFQHFGNPEAHQFSSESHERDKSYENFDPFFNPYFHGNGWDHMPGINNVFNIPNPGYNSHRHNPSHRGNNPQEKPKQDHNGEPNTQNPEEKPKEIPPIDKKPTEQDKGPKLNEASILDANNKINEPNIPDVDNKSGEPTIPDPIANGDLLPPKTNAIKKEDNNSELNKGDKQVDVDKKKDYLLVGQGNNGNNLYLLHENNPNPTTVFTPNGNQPGNNIIYVPYNPGQNTNQVYQVVNGQPAPSNIQMTPDKLGVSNGYNNALPSPGQSTSNLNSGTQNPGYVTIYSNGQLIQIPGVVVNSSPNNVPVQNGNQVQGTNYIIANAVPNNVQSAPAIQNPGTNVIYATIPNPASNGPIYVQVPNCMNTMSNGCGSGAITQNGGLNNGMTNNGLPSNVIVYQANPNTGSQPALSNGYIQPNMAANQGQGAITVAIPNNQNVQYQPAVQFPVNSGSNGYNQPIVSNLGQGQNVPNQKEKQVVSYQPMMSTNPGNQPIYQPAVQTPVNSGTNWYNQPIVSNQAQGQNAPIQTTMVNNQNTPEQSGVVIPIPSGYDHPLITNPIVNVENRGDMSSNQNGAQPAVSVNGNTNDQGTNAIVNTPSNTEVINHESDVSQPLATSTLVLDSSNLSALGAQPAIMIADFKDKSGEKKDKKKSKDKKEKKDKEKKKEKPKDDNKLKDSEPYTNKKI